ncbi:hypothetical protein H4R27_001615 [Coemansia aciculifera]|nr:hypothetical protein H4R27_001615 [Coemansia aciculifera]
MAPSKLSNDARKKLAANLQVLRRYDDQIEAIIDTTSHVVLYQFQETTQEWKNKEVEGALFIYKRFSAPHYGFTIMNRLGLENFTEHLSADMNFQTSDQIIMYTSTSGSGILGVWIYEEADRVRIPEQLGQCCKSVKSAFSGQSPQRLYPKNSDEEKEFERLYPRSRSNSRKDAGADYQGSSNALSTIVNHSRQKQQQNQKKNAGDVNVPAVPNGNVLDLASKMQAIGIDFNAGPEPQDTSANARALPSDPAIIMARKSVKPHELNATGGDGGQKPQHQQQQQQNQFTQANSESDSLEFRSPLSVPAVHANSGNVSYHSVGGGAPAGVPQPASPVLHPVPSPFPPSTIATPLPGPQQVGPNMAYAQQMPQYWYHPQMATSPPVNRSAHASPAPPNFGGMMPGMYAFPQLPLGHPGHPGTAHVSQPMMHMGPAQQQQQQPAQAQPPPPPPPQFVPGPMQPGLPVSQGAVPRAPDAVGGGNPSVAHNLAEQLVSLVRQRMNSTQQGPLAVGNQQKPALSPDAMKAQRDYCREWLIRVIQADDELVDAFAQRFPPPIFPPPAGNR